MLKKDALIKTSLILLLCWMGFVHPLSAQQIDLNQPLPVDPNVTIGKLSNGLKYYIRPNNKPENKLELRLVVNAGSVLEDDDQQGLAHFMEHMNFNGLKHFPKNELVNYLQKIGVKFGADLNANTGFDRTYFILPIPTDNPENIKNGFQIVADWAGGALISPEEVKDERKVVFEEYRSSQEDANARMLKQILPDMVNNSRYAKRLPIGKKDIILNATPDLVKRFYKDWYRPDNMAVIVVGDIKAKEARKMIKKYFGNLTNPKNERPRKVYTVKPYTQEKAIIVTDPEATSYDFSLMFSPKVRKPEKTLKDYRSSIVRALFINTLNKKLRELSQTSNPPYTGASASASGAFGGLTLKNEGFNLDITPTDNYKVAIDSAVGEILRIRDYGFFESDLKNTKKRILSSYERAYKERNKVLSIALVGEYTDNFMKDAPIPGIENEYKFIKELLPTITTKEVSAYAHKILSNSKNFFAMATGPENGDIDIPAEKELLGIVHKALKQKVSAPKEKASATSLLTNLPLPGEIVSQTEDKQLGTTNYTLSNGVKVTVKPTDFKDDEIIFSGAKYGGTGQYGPEDKINLGLMGAVIGAMGYGEFTPTALQDFLSGKQASVGMSMNGVADNVKGSSSVKDLETLLQLNYLKLTEPRVDQDLYQGFLTKMKTQIKFLSSNPQYAFQDTLTKVMYDNSPLTPLVIPTSSDMDKINLDRIMEIYKTEFGNADGFHFFFVGNVDKNTLEPLMKKYLASLPVKGDTPTYKDNGLREVKGDKTFKFYKGSDNKSMVLYQIHGNDIKYSEKLSLDASLLGQIMTNQITDTIREKMQVIYSGGASASVGHIPYTNYNVTMQLPTGPESVEAILKEVDKEIKGYKANGGPKGSLQKVKKATLEEHKENVKKNGYWASQLQQIALWGKSKDYVLDFDKKVEAVTKQDIIKTANLLLNGDRFIAISYPESAKE